MKTEDQRKFNRAVERAGGNDENFRIILYEEFGLKLDRIKAKHRSRGGAENALGALLQLCETFDRTNADDFPGEPLANPFADWGIDVSSYALRGWFEGASEVSELHDFIPNTYVLAMRHLDHKASVKSALTCVSSKKMKRISMEINA